MPTRPGFYLPDCWLSSLWRDPRRTIPSARHWRRCPAGGPPRGLLKCANWGSAAYAADWQWRFPLHERPRGSAPVGTDLTSCSFCYHWTHRYASGKAIEPSQRLFLWFWASPPPTGVHPDRILLAQPTTCTHYTTLLHTTSTYQHHTLPVPYRHHHPQSRAIL